MSQSRDAGDLDREWPPSRIDTTVAHNARVWDYWLGGKDNFQVDRQVGDHVRTMFPIIGDVARANRQFLVRVVRFLAGDAGIRQRRASPTTSTPTSTTPTRSWPRLRGRWTSPSRWRS